MRYASIFSGVEALDMLADPIEGKN
ncbi:MAG: hypothetical protein [Bacteriophage sp.]|nr:MAG: hypothetical protein [Bacteriophage sp.]UVX34582.1 MAG: hypothetical protein [Bacteriophage sp.]UWF99530.1 MAG: hypothetical protein [Bacteriophage sp.]